MIRHPLSRKAVKRDSPEGRGIIKKYYIIPLKNNSFEQLQNKARALGMFGYGFETKKKIIEKLEAYYRGEEYDFDSSFKEQQEFHGTLVDKTKKITTAEDVGFSSDRTALNETTERASNPTHKKDLHSDHQRAVPL